MRKLTSTNAFNETQINDNCGMAYALSVLGGRWVPSILTNLTSGPLRYSDLKKALPLISERMLVAQLRSLEKFLIIKRIVYAQVPPRVDYELTDFGMTMLPMLKSMSDWGNMHREHIKNVIQKNALTGESLVE